MSHRSVTAVLLACAVALLVVVAAPPRADALSKTDLQMRQNILLLRGYIDTATGRHAFVCPAKSAVRKGGGLPAPAWPTDLWTGRAMAPGNSKGGYAYTPSPGGDGYTLVGHLSSSSYTVRGAAPTWLAAERAEAAADLAAAWGALAGAQDRAIISGTGLLREYVEDLARGTGHGRRRLRIRARRGRVVHDRPAPAAAGGTPG